MKFLEVKSIAAKIKKLCFLGFCFLGLIFLLFASVGTLHAQNADYNRPNPTMDYVPQEIGIYDTVYSELTEQDCRTCHGNSTADRHHGVPIVVNDHLCSPCHPTCTVGSPDCENGITIHRNCLTSGCHSWDDVQSGNKKWHHNTDMSDSDNCITCHDPNIIDKITPLHDLQTYPPTVVTPTPFSCENCHYNQSVSVGIGPNHPGHPSTYQHYDQWGNLINFYEYNKPIYSNMDTHHMGFEGNVSNKCYKCHSLDPSNPSWDPDNPELIRYCEICHSIRTLHAIGPHVSEHDGWKPVGFHAGGGGPDPTIYAKWGSTPYAPQVKPGYTVDMQCFGCHGDTVPSFEEDSSCEPVIDSQSTVAGSCGMVVTLKGNCFGEEHITGRQVQLKLKADPVAEWTNMPIHTWTDNFIEFKIPCWILTSGNYLVRVHTENGNSNKTIFTIKDNPSLLSITPDRGSCSEWITLNGNGFDVKQSKMFDSYYGVTHVVDFVASSGVYTATIYRNWTDESFQVKLYKLFKDKVDTCSIDPLTQQPWNYRNFVQDVGDEGGTAGVKCDNAAPIYDECAAEPTIPRCDSLSIGTFSVYIKAIYFGDEDASGDLSCGDTIFQVETGDPKYFELTNVPYIYKLNPKNILDKTEGNIAPLLKIYGGNYGPTQQVGDCARIGTKAQADNVSLGLGKEMTNIKGWSNTLIKVRFNAPNAWQDKTRFVWVEKNGKKSNYKPLKILAP
jgi:hypothetical protein